MFSSPKKWIPMPSRFGHAQWSWPRNERLVTNDVTSGICQSFLFFAWRPHCFANLILFVFCGGKPLTTTETTVTWTGRISWFLTWRHDPFRNPDPFLHWLTINMIGRGWSGNFKARSLKSWNPIFFLEYLLTHYTATITIKTLLAVYTL